MKRSKKLLAGALSFTLACGMMFTGITATAGAPILIGDVNLDGVVSMPDYLLLRNQLMGTENTLTGDALMAANTTKDPQDTVNMSDLLALRSAVMSGQTLGYLNNNLKLNPAVVEVDEGSVSLVRAIVAPYDVENYIPTFTSADPSIATIDQNGQVKGIKAGTTTVSATAEDGSRKIATVNVRAKSPYPQQDAINGSITYNLRDFYINNATTPLGESIIYNSHWNQSTDNYIHFYLEVTRPGTYDMVAKISNGLTAGAVDIRLPLDYNYVGESTVSNSVIVNNTLANWGTFVDSKTTVTFSKVGTVEFKLKRPTKNEGINISGMAILADTSASVQNFRVSSAPTTNSATLAWNTYSTATKYQLFLDDATTPIEVNGTTYTFSGLKSRYPYKFTIKALDAANTVVSKQDSLTYCMTKEEPVARESRLNWWKEARYGLFIHWGGFSTLAGEFNGTNTAGITGRHMTSRGLPESIANLPDVKPYGNYAEWILNGAKVPLPNYMGISNKNFTAANFNATDYVNAAKSSGMKYIVITAKHHEGFTLFATDDFSWNIQDSAVGQRDILRELKNACDAAGIQFGMYYSYATDWSAYGSRGTISSLYNTTTKKDAIYKESENEKYLNQVLIPHIKKITQDYGIKSLWWDYAMNEGNPSNEFKYKAFKAVMDAVPDASTKMILNNRMSMAKNGTGLDYFETSDYDTPEQHIPFYAPSGRTDNWETCMTLNDNWGYCEHDSHWKAKSEVVMKLLDIVSKNGNFLLNIGPKGDGTIPAESLDRLAAVGKWITANGNGEAIYGSAPSPFKKQLPYGRATQKLTKDASNNITKTDLYIHVFNQFNNAFDDPKNPGWSEKDPNTQKWPTNGELLIPGLTSAPVGMKATFLHDPTKSFDVVADATIKGYKIVGLDAAPPEYLSGEESFATTFKLTFNGAVVTTNPPTPAGTIAQDTNGVIAMTADKAGIIDANNNNNMPAFNASTSSIENWADNGDYVWWNVTTNRTLTNNYKLTINCSTNGNANLRQFEFIEENSGTVYPISFTPSAADGLTVFKDWTFTVDLSRLPIRSDYKFKLVRKSALASLKSVTLQPN